MNQTWNTGHWRAMRDTQGEGYILYHVGQEGQLDMSYPELCELSIMLDQMIREHKIKVEKSR